LKRKLVPSALVFIQYTDEKQSLEDNETQSMVLFVVTYECERVVIREVLHGLQQLERNKYKFTQILEDEN